jgi:tripartite-type tricarboxylate transporter receptor subunit TctC
MEGSKRMKGGVSRIHGFFNAVRGSKARRSGWLIGVLALVGSVLCLPAAPACADQSAADFYKGKTVTMLVGSPPGGGYDLYARLIAPYLAKKLDAQIIIENRAGGSGLLALNILNSSRPDGLTLMNVSAEGAIMSKLVDRPGARWDLQKLNWLARVAEEPKVWFVSPKGKIHSFSDAINAPKLLWSATGPADNISDVVAVVSEATGLHSKVVTGYKGAKDMALAVANGEVDSGILTVSSVLPMLKSGDLAAIAVISRKRWADLPNVPTIFEVGHIAPQNAWWIDFREQVGEMQRAIATTPGVPQDRVAFLREKLREVLTDPVVIAQAQKANIPVSFLDGAELQNQIGKIMQDAAGSHLPQIQQVVLNKYF